MQIETEHFGHMVVERAVEMGETEDVNLTSTSFLEKYCPSKGDGDGICFSPELKFSFWDCGVKYSGEVCFN